MDFLLEKFLDGSALTTILATVLGCMFGLLAFVLLNSQGASIDPKIHWIVAIVVFLAAAGAINAFLKVKTPAHGDHH